MILKGEPTMQKIFEPRLVGILLDFIRELIKVPVRFLRPPRNDLWHTPASDQPKKVKKWPRHDAGLGV